jgi:hypothetical protein
MARRFIVGTSELDVQQTKRFVEFIKANNYAWWHWLPNFWLLKTSRSEPDTLSAAAIRDEIKRIAPHAHSLVMETHEDISWATTGHANARGVKFADWLRDTWPD